MTQADMNAALDRWYARGDLRRETWRRAKDGLELAFQIACSDYLAALTAEVCGEGGAR